MPLYEDSEIDYINQCKAQANKLIRSSSRFRDRKSVRDHIIRQGTRPHFHSGEWMGLIEDQAGKIGTGSKLLLRQLALMIAEGHFPTPKVDVDSERARRAKHILRTEYMHEPDNLIRYTIKSSPYVPQMKNGKWTGDAENGVGDQVTLNHQERVQMAKLINEGYFGIEPM
ncbi:MAG TPA: hypothetical protein PLO61_07645 [Fimbriimonadaceae bacterium]|nr:hypothetical protein [Fimbriimonadaceae bacterium]HRJ33000.1 hypothetical protein [Fimbriimonadaceae bacterium]